MKKFIAFCLLLSNLFQVVFAAFPPASNNTHSSYQQTNQSSSNTVTAMDNLNITMDQLGIAGPLTGGVNYSSLTGAFFSGQFNQKINDWAGFNILGEYGQNQYRINGTLGFLFATQSLFKVSAEQLSQRLPFFFDSGAIKKRVNQQAFGAKFQQYFDSTLINNVSGGAYSANAPNIGLKPITFISDGSNCAGFEAGLKCMNERNIAGARAMGGDLNAGFYLSPWTYLEGRAYYDSLRYHTIFSKQSQFDNQGFGGGIYVQQLFMPNLKFSASAELRKIYDTYNVELSWMPAHPFARGSEFSLMTQRVVSHNNQMPDNDLIGVKLNVFADKNSYQSPSYRLNGASIINDIAAWVQTPAVKMNQVLAIAEQYTHLIAPSITSINPTSGPVSGGNTIVISGSNFPSTTTVQIGGKTAQMVSITQSAITVIAPAATSPGIVDVVLLIAGILPVTETGGYAYVNGVLPVIAGISPSSVSTTGGTQITINGSGFTGVTAVTIGGNPATSFTVVSDTQITAIAPAHAPGAVNVTVTSPVGTSLPRVINYIVPSILINSVSPNSGPAAGGTLITINGSGLTSVTTVSVGGTPATNVTVVNDSQVTAVTPSHAPGLVDIIVSNGVSSATLSSAYTYAFPLPIISSLNPSTGSTAGGTTITINGSGFSGTTAVNIDGNPAASFTVLSNTQISAVTPAHAAGTVNVTVTTPGGTSAPQPFNYVASVPVISAVTPVSGPTTGGTLLSITGSGLTGTATISVGGTLATNVTVVNDTQVTAVTPSHIAGLVDVVVSNGSTNTTVANAFTYIAQPPVINVNGINPFSGSTAGGTLITLTGSGFTGATSVTVDGISATNLTIVSDTQLTALTPAHAAGTVGVIVVTLGGSSAPQPFTYVPPTPVINAISPTTGSTLGGTTITLTGSGFIGATAVSVDGLPATSLNVVSDTQLTAVTPAHAAGSVGVTVTTPGGTSAAQTFTYVISALNIISVTPITGPTAGGTVLTITGAGFVNTSTVSVGGVPATGVVFNNSTQLTAITPAHAAGLVDVVVTSGGTNTTATGAYTYIAPVPVVNTINPSSGPTGGGTTITLTGSGFTSATAVTIGGTPATNFTVISDSQITAVTPTHAAGAVNVTVTTAGGTSAPQTFTYVAFPPVINANGISPSSGPTSGGTTITISGVGFTGTTGVTIGGNPATNIIVVSDAQLTAITPAHAAGAVGVTVTTAGGTSAPRIFTYLPPTPVINANGITPNLGPTSGGTLITINGSGFTGVNAVSLGGTPATNVTVVSDSVVTAVTAARAAGLVNVVVSNGITNATAVSAYTYVASTPVINVNGINPASGSTAGGTTITLTGSGFIGASAVTIDGNPVANFTVVSDTQITAITPAHVAATVGVTVTTAGGTSQPRPFTYVASSLTVANVTPSSGPTAGGTTLTINGAGFTGTNAVSVGGLPASSLTVINDNQLTAVTPAHIAGLVDIVVSNGGTNTTAVGAYTYVAPLPVINLNGINPSSGSTLGGTTITLSGSGFTGATAVTVDGIPATGLVVISDSQISAVTPAHAAGSVGVTVTTAGGTSAPQSFTYTAITPVINAGGINPSSGPTAGGTTITINGSGLTGTNAVSVGGAPATSVTVISDSQVRAVTPAHVAGLVDVVISNGITNTTAIDAFTYVAPIPVINLNGITPASGTTLGGTAITLTGSGFIGATAVNIDGLLATSVVVVSDTQITAFTPAHVAGTVNITVSTAGGTSAPQPYTYVAPVPVINPNGLSPNSGSTLGGTSVTITGSGFTGTLAVSIDGVAATSFNVVSDTQLTAVTPAHAAGPVDVTVTTVGGTSAPQTFTYVVSPLTITNVTPITGPTAGGTVITITGQAFTGSNAVSIGGLPATSFSVDSDTQITATTPARAAGLVDVVVTNNGSNITALGAFTYVAPVPVINVNGINPSSGTTLGGTTLTITGSGFIGANAVTIGGSPAVNFSVLSDTQITAVTPARAAGAVNVTVTTAGGTSAPQIFTYVAPIPVININGIAPSSGSTLGGTTITISGSGFSGTTAVVVGGNLATGVVVVSDSQITAVTPAHAAGLVDVTVITPGGTSAPQGFTYIAPTPVINVGGVSPSSGPAAGGTTITISGSGLTGINAVSLGGLPATNVTVISDNQVTAVTPARAAGLVDVLVSNGTTNTTASNAYTYVAITPVINLNGINPSSGSTLGGTTITLSGSGFTGATAVTIDGILASSVVVISDTQISAVTPAHAPGSVGVTVTTAGGTSAPQPFTYTAIPPVINPGGISPSSGPTSGGTTLTINGSGLTGTNAVSVGGVPATSVTVINDGQVTAVTSSRVAGLVNVVISNGVTNTTAIDAFTYVAPVPVINLNGIAPPSGTTLGGTAITLTGSGFIGATAVTMDGLPATGVIVVSDTQITAITPAHTPGAVDVTVSTAGGTSVPQPYTYVAPVPVITLNGLSPNSGSTLGGTTVTITGSGFTAASAVTFGGDPAASFTVLSDTQITAMTPAHAAGPVDVLVTTPGGISTPQTFTYVVTPLTINNATPVSGPTAGGTVLTISGSGFTGSSAVSIGGTPATSFSVDSDTQITATTPAHAAGLVDVVVTNNGSNITALGAFTYIAPLPVINVNGINPNSGSTLGGTTLTISGSGFTGANAVSIDGSPATTFFVLSDTQITAVTPAHAAGVVDVTVTTAGGTSAPQPFTYVALTPVINPNGINPSSGSTLGGTTITISGSGLTGITDVTVGGVAATAVTVINDNQLTAVTAPHAAGLVDVVVSNGSTNTTAPNAYTYVAPIPVINPNGVTPSSGPTAGGTLITINGSGLTGTIAVSVGGAVATSVTVVNDNQVTAVTSARAAGLVDVVVSNGSTNTTAANAYTYVAPTPVINVNGITPSSGSTLGGTTITINGFGFIGATAVTIDGLPATSFTVISDVQITAMTPAHAAGVVNVTVTTAGGTSAPQLFTYVAPPPSINPGGVTPNSGSTAGGTTITINGSGLTGTIGVAVGGVLATNVTVINDNQVTAVTSPRVAGLVDVVVSNSTTNATATNAYTYIAPTPVINVNGITPNSGPTVGGTAITLNGSGFIGATAVTIGGIPATNFTVVSNTQINAVTPANAAGAVGVTVTTAGGTSAPQTFTYLAPPALTNLTPTSGTSAGGTTITINGSGLTGATAVSVGGTPATAVTVISDTQLTAITPAHVAGLVSVIVATPRGNATLPNSYTYLQPVLSSCSAPLISVVGAQLVTCSLSNFLSVGVLSTTLVASGTNLTGANCSNFTQPSLASIGLLGTVTIPATGLGGLLSPGLIGCNIRLCDTTSCNAPGDTTSSLVTLGL